MHPEDRIRRAPAIPHVGLPAGTSTDEIIRLARERARRRAMGLERHEDAKFTTPRGDVPTRRPLTEEEAQHKRRHEEAPNPFEGRIRVAMPERMPIPEQMRDTASGERLGVQLSSPLEGSPVARAMKEEARDFRLQQLLEETATPAPEGEGTVLRDDPPAPLMIPEDEAQIIEETSEYIPQVDTEEALARMRETRRRALAGTLVLRETPSDREASLEGVTGIDPAAPQVRRAVRPVTDPPVVSGSQFSFRTEDGEVHSFPASGSGLRQAQALLEDTYGMDPGAAEIYLRRVQSPPARGRGVRPIGTVETSQSFGISGPVHPDSIEALRAADKAALEANRERLIASQEAAETGALALRGIADREQELAAEAAAAEADRQAQLSDRLGRVDELVQQVRDAEVDPGRFLGDWGRRIGAAILVGLGAASTRPGDQNSVLHMINQGIERDIQGQIANIRNLAGAARMESQAFGLLRSTLDSERAQEAAMRVLYLQEAQRRAQAMVGQVDAESQIALQGLLAALAEQQQAQASIVAQQENGAISITRATETPIFPPRGRVRGRGAIGGMGISPTQLPGGESVEDARESLREQIDAMPGHGFSGLPDTAVQVGGVWDSLNPAQRAEARNVLGSYNSLRRIRQRINGIVQSEQDWQGAFMRPNTDAAIALAGQVALAMEQIRVLGEMGAPQQADLERLRELIPDASAQSVFTVLRDAFRGGRGNYLLNQLLGTIEAFSDPQIIGREMGDIYGIIPRSVQGVMSEEQQPISEPGRIETGQQLLDERRPLDEAVQMRRAERLIERLGPR